MSKNIRFGYAGKFVQTTDLMYVCDPIYKIGFDGEDLIQKLSDVQTGTYHVLVGAQDKLAQSLNIFHESVFTGGEDKDWFSYEALFEATPKVDFELVTKKFTTNTEMAGCYDSAFKDNVKEFTVYADFYKKNKSRSWYDIISKQVKIAGIVAIAPHSATTLTDHGNGPFSLFAAIYHGKIVAVCIDYSGKTSSKIKTNVGPSIPRQFIVIGTFLQTSDLMYASDPSYRPPEDKTRKKYPDGRLKIDKVTPGTYYVISEVKGAYPQALLVFHESVFKPGKRIVYTEKAMLKIINEFEFKVPTRKEGDEKSVTDISVDTGTAGFFDAAYKDDVEIFRSLIKTRRRKPITWWNIVANTIVANRNHAFVIPYGAISPTAYGDGVYDCYIARHNGKMVAAYIDFIGVENR
jgi:hypothetical protein